MYIMSTDIKFKIIVLKLNSGSSWKLVWNYFKHWKSANSKPSFWITCSEHFLFPHVAFVFDRTTDRTFGHFWAGNKRVQPRTRYQWHTVMIIKLQRWQNQRACIKMQIYARRTALKLSYSIRFIVVVRWETCNTKILNKVFSFAMNMQCKPSIAANSALDFDPLQIIFKIFNKKYSEEKYATFLSRYQNGFLNR